MKNKRGQSGLSAAILVAIISGLIILYIMFLPAEEREKLFENKSDSDGSTKVNESEGMVLLSENPGRLDTVGKVEDKYIPNVYLYETTNAKVLEKITPINVRNGWFDKKIKTVQFDLEDLDNTGNVIISFTASKRKGLLTIKLNEVVVYEFEPTSINVEPIPLPKNILQPTNTLEFSVSGVGIRFWDTNEYALENIGIIGDITDISRQQSRNTFELTASEYLNLKKADMRFIPYCSNVANVGRLDILVNSRNVYSSVPVCDDRAIIPILGDLREGENNVVFKTNKGSYSIEQIKIDLEVKEVPTVKYFYEVGDEDYDDIKNDEKGINLTIKFIDDGEIKKGDVNINGLKRSFNQYKPVYSLDLSYPTERGNNYIELIPRNTLHIVNLKIALFDKD